MTTKAKQVLLVDDEQKLLDALSQRLDLLGFDVHTAINGKAAIDIARNIPLDLAIVDLQMPDMNGLVAITKLKEITPGLKTILLTGHGNEKIKQTTESLNSLYFEKDEMDNFWGFIKQLTTEGKMVVIRPGTKMSPSTNSNGMPAGTFDGNEIEIRSDTHFQTNHPFKASFDGGRQPGALSRSRIVGETTPMQKLRKSIKQVATLSCPVIIRGETGTGKELAARAIHAESRHANDRFIAINSGCFGNEQSIGQLFGLKNDNLAEAIQSQNDTLNADRVGTILFDHIEDMPLRLQLQLLKIIDATEISPISRTNQGRDGVGAIRILVATDTDLNQSIKSGSFRKDLYYRLNLFELSVPPLRDRKDDIPPLSYYFLEKYRIEFNKQVDSISEKVLDSFAAYDFPGNVRELEHIIERAVILADDKIIAPNHLPGRFGKKATAQSSEVGRFATMAEMETQYIIEVLKASKGNKSKTAEILGISRAALWRKLKQINTDRMD